MLPQKGIEICICTFNREEYLRQCVELLLPQLNQTGTGLTIVNNNSTDNTEDYVKSLMGQYKAVRYFFEPVQGISHALNRGWKESSHEWMFYLDDDCLPSQDLVAEALRCINEHADVAAIGGSIYPVFNTSPPAWLPEGFGEFKMPFDKFTIIDRGYIRGGCFLTQRNILEELGGYSTDLGMKGYKIAYGEELELQDRMRAKGYKIAYAPTLAIGHQVRVEKLNTGWILQSEYARRRDKMAFAPKPFLEVTFNLIRTAGGRILWAPIHLMKLSTNSKYTLSNFRIDTFGPLAYRWGEFVGVIKRKKSTKKR